MSSSSNQTSSLLQLPDEVLGMILGYLSFNEISNLRIICVRFDEVCKRLLNLGFRSAEQHHTRLQKEVKRLLPRRESERRDHPLAPHCNILSGIETRLSLLNMTFLKYIEAKFCCFIPGKVVDEILRVLRFVKTTMDLYLKAEALDAPENILKDLRANQILKELRDISSMAMEHFEEKILPSFKSASSSSPITALSLYASSPFQFSPSPLFAFARDLVMSGSSSSGGGGGSSKPSSSLYSEQLTHMGHLKMFSKQNKTQIASMKKQITHLNKKLNESSRKINDQEQVILELNRVLTEQTSKLADQDNKFSEMNNKLMSNERKISTLLNMVNNSKKKKKKKKVEVKEEEEEDNKTLSDGGTFSAAVSSAVAADIPEGGVVVKVESFSSPPPTNTNTSNLLPSSASPSDPSSMTSEFTPPLRMRLRKRRASPDFSANPPKQKQRQRRLLVLQQ